MAISPVVAAAPAATSAPTPTDAGSVLPLGGRKNGRGLDMKKIILFAALGAFAGFLVPVIPGGPAGGALIGAALGFLL